MSDSTLPWFADDMLTHGVLWRRVGGWFVDAVLIGLLVFVLWWLLVLFGFLTLGLGFPLLGVLPLVPFLYQLLSMLGPGSATPGQQVFGLVVRRNDDLGPPMPLQVVLFILGFAVTMATCGLLLAVALVTVRHRTLHDLVSGLVVVRVRGMYALTAPPGSWNMPGGQSYS
ncbi:MAG TPA: RDD family protein [Acetobacteraceae bacterium]|nr:RDD family protein [Acetobacteraceae bacterium]